MFISVFCKSCEPDIVQKFSHNIGSQLLQNTEIIKQTDFGKSEE